MLGRAAAGRAKAKAKARGVAAAKGKARAKAKAVPLPARRGRCAAVAVEAVAIPAGRAGARVGGQGHPEVGNGLAGVPAVEPVAIAPPVARAAGPGPLLAAAVAGVRAGGGLAPMPAAAPILPNYDELPEIGGVGGAAGNGGAPGGGCNIPWVHGPSNPLQMKWLGQQPGSIIEVGVYDKQGAVAATALFELQHCYPSDAMGIFAEVRFHGCSSEAIAGTLDGFFRGDNKMVLHLCTVDVNFCAGQNGLPGRMSLHSDYARLRPLYGIAERWASPALMAAAHQAMQQAGPMGPNLMGQGAGAGGLMAGAAGLGGLGAPGAMMGGARAMDVEHLIGGARQAAARDDGPPTDAELKQKVLELKRRLKEKRNAGSVNLGTLIARGVKQGKRKNRKDKKDKEKDDDDLSSSSSVFEDALTRHNGSASAIQKVAEEKPGALFALGMQQIKKLLAGRGGAASDVLDDGHISPSVMTYLHSVWHGRHSPSSMTQRDLHELHTIGLCLDDLINGQLNELGDKLMQRLKGLQQRQSDGHWQVAQRLEICDANDVNLATTAETRAAADDQKKAVQLQEKLAKSGLRGRSPPP